MKNNLVKIFTLTGAIFVAGLASADETGQSHAESFTGGSMGLEHLDLNKDGVVSSEEFAAHQATSHNYTHKHNNEPGADR